MKRFWLGAVLLAVLFGFCLFAMLYTARCTETMQDYLLSAEQAAEKEDFSSAAKQIAAALEEWKTHGRILGALLRHDEADCVESDLASLAQYADFRDALDFSAVCAGLRQKLRHIKDMECPKIENIL